MTGVDKNFFVGSVENSDETIDGYMIVSNNFEYFDSKERFKIEPDTFFDTKEKFFFYFSAIPLNIFNHYSPIDIDAKQSRIVKILVKVKDIVDFDGNSSLMKASKIFVQKELTVSELMKAQDNFIKIAGKSFLEKKFDDDDKMPNSCLYIGADIGGNFLKLSEEHETGNDTFKIITDTVNYEFIAFNGSDYFHYKNMAFNNAFSSKVPFYNRDEHSKAYIDFTSYGNYNKINISTPKNNIYLMGSRSKLLINENENMVYSIGQKNNISVVENSNIICSYGNNATINVDGVKNTILIYGGNSTVSLNGNNNVISSFGNNNIINVCENNQSCVVSGKNNNIFVYAKTFSFSGTNGSVFHFAKFDDDNNIIGFSKHVIGDSVLKENTYYTFKDGEIN